MPRKEGHTWGWELPRKDIKFRGAVSYGHMSAEPRIWLSKLEWLQTSSISATFVMEYEGETRGKLVVVIGAHSSPTHIYCPFWKDMPH